MRKCAQHAGVLAMVFCGLPGVAAASSPEGGQVAAAEHALWADAQLIDAVSGKRFNVTLMAPSGVVTGTGPVGGHGVDLRQPVAKLSTWDGKRGCSAWGTPTRFSPGQQGSKPGAVTNVSFDMTCNDGSGYDFYRVKLIEDPPSSYYTVLGAFPWAWPGAFGQFLITFAGAERAYEGAHLQVCGHSASRVTCAAAPPPGSGNWANISFYDAATITEVSAIY